MPSPNSTFCEGGRNLFKTHDPLSTIPRVKNIRDPDDPSKLQLHYQYDIPVVMLDVKYWDKSTSGILVFTDFSGITTESAMKGHKVPPSIDSSDYGIGEYQIPRNMLFNSSILSNQYEELIIEMSKSELLGKHGFVIARLNIDIRIIYCKYVEGYYNRVQFVDSHNVEEVFDGMQVEFLNMLFRMKSFCTPNKYDELRADYNFGLFEIEMKDKEKDRIEMEGPLESQKRPRLNDNRNTADGASEILLNKMVPDNERARFGPQSTQEPVEESVSSGLQFNSMSNIISQPNQGLLTPKLDPQDNPKSLISQDESSTLLHGNNIEPPLTLQHRINASSRPLGASVVFRPIASDSQSPTRQKSDGRLLISRSQTQTQTHTTTDTDPHSTIADYLSILNNDELTAAPIWNETAIDFLKDVINQRDITMKELLHLKTIEENSKYNLCSIKVKGIRYIDHWKVSPNNQKTKLAPIKLVVEDANNQKPAVEIEIEISNDEELRVFFGFSGSEISQPQYKKINTLLNKLMELNQKTLTIKISRKLRQLSGNYKYAYWTCSTSIENLLKQ